MSIGNDGGPAFPGPGMCMSMRDWFAGMASTQLVYEGEDGCPRYPEDVAHRAYAIADAMLIERTKR